MNLYVDGGKRWVDNAARKCVSALQDIRDDENMQRASYCKLASRLPSSTKEMFPGMEKQSLRDQMHSLVKLLNHHTGEQVELSPKLNQRILCKVRAPTQVHTQFATRPPTLGGGFVCEAGSEEFGKVSEANIQAMVQYYVEIWGLGQPGDYFPDWAAQTNRLTCPCKRASEFHWIRYCMTTGLGGIFAALGQDYDAALLYYFYRTRMVVCMKRQKR